MTVLTVVCPTIVDSIDSPVCCTSIVRPEHSRKPCVTQDSSACFPDRHLYADVVVRTSIESEVSEQLVREFAYLALPEFPARDSTRDAIDHGDDITNGRPH